MRLGWDSFFWWCKGAKKENECSGGVLCQKQIQLKNLTEPIYIVTFYLKLNTILDNQIIKHQQPRIKATDQVKRTLQNRDSAKAKGNI